MLSLPPLSLYIHFPWCVRKCPYCDFNSHVAKDLPQKHYVDTLLKDLKHDHAYVKGRAIQSIYLGGGTPSLFEGSFIHELLNTIYQIVGIASNAEITIEANPESVTLKKLDDYQKAGINRISLGVQSLEDVYLKRLGRAHSSQVAYQAIHTILKSGLTNFNLDLMHGLPGQTYQAGLKDIQAALEFKPTHLSWYQLTLEPHTAFFKRPPILPSEDTLIELQTEGIQQLGKAGFIQYEIAAFSQAGFACYHNTNYWSFGDYIGIGAGAHSKLSLDSGTRIRYSKPYDPNTYLSQDCFLNKTEEIPHHQLAFEFMLNALRLYQPIEAQLFEARTGLSWQSLFPVFETAANKGLVEWDPTKLMVTAFGRRFYNDLVTLFL